MYSSSFQKQQIAFVICEKNAWSYSISLLYWDEQTLKMRRIFKR